MSKRRRKRGLGIDRRLLILFSVTPIGCLLAMLVGLLITWYLFPTRFVNANLDDLPQEEADEIVIMVASDFAEHNDIERARELLAELKVPNEAQYVSLVAERLVRTNRGPVEQEIEEVVRLADALGVSTVSMIAYISTPTPTFTPTPQPTPTPTNTLVMAQAAQTEPQVEAQAEVASAAVIEEVEPTPEPTEAPPTDTPTAVPPTNTPAPPTDTPEPTATPTPEVDFFITKQRLFTKEENGGCLGMHSIFITVVDAAGNPLKGVEIADEWGNFTILTGHKGEDKPGEAVIDLWKNGFKIFVKNDPTAGHPVSSQMSDLLSSNDWEIGIPRLIEAGYCPDEATCRVLWNSGVFGEGNNSLCWGHYSWELVFQRSW